VPIYEYQCKSCGQSYELMRSRAQMDEATKCAHCSSKATKRKLSVFGATPGALSAGAAIVTRGDERVAAELTLSLVEDTIVTDPSGAEPFGIEAEPIAVSLHRALAEEEREREEVPA